MSWVLPGNKALIANAIDLSSQLPVGSSICIGYWIKRAHTTVARGSLLNTSDAAFARWLEDADETIRVLLRDISTAQIGFINSTVVMPNNNWGLVLIEYDEAIDEGRVSVDNSTHAGAAVDINFSMSNSSTVAWGRDFDGTYSGAHKLAHMFIANRVPTSTERANLVAGANPEAVFGANIVDYVWDSKTSRKGFTYVDEGTGSAITWDAGDNPTVDDPSAAGPSVTLAHVERGRTICRGLARGVAG